jgi:hypothetical protein
LYAIKELYIQLANLHKAVVLLRRNHTLAKYLKDNINGN